MNKQRLVIYIDEFELDILSICMSGHHMPEERIGSPETKVTDGYKPTDWSLELNWVLWKSSRTLNC